MNMKRITLSLFLSVVCCLTLCAQPKYIFFFIGDGMGCNEVMATEMFRAEMEGRIGTKHICFTQFPFSGQLSNYSASNSITDSSAAGTCLASGVKTTNHNEGVDPDGKPAISVAEQLHKMGWKVAVTSSVSIDHATPGAFYAHVKNRSDYYSIGCQLAETGYEFFGGAAFLGPMNKKDSTLPSVYELCEKNGYVFVHGIEEYPKYMNNDKLILIQRHEGHDRTKSGAGMIPYALGRPNGSMTLAQIVETGLAHLGDEQPFFFMCEGGSIDWACHTNDGGAMVREVEDFDNAVQVAYKFYLQHPDETLILVTADHETGGCALGNSNYTLNLKLFSNQKVSIGTLNDHIRKLHKQHGKKLTWNHVMDVLTEDLGFYKGVEITAKEDAELRGLFKKMMSGKDKSVKTLYSEVDELTNTAIRILNTKAKLGWTTKGHTASPVPIFSIGYNAAAFAGWHDNSEIAPLIMKTVGK